MKKTILPIYAISLLLLMGLFLPQGVQAQNQAQILEQIIDLPELQQHYPLNADGNQKQVNILQQPVSFPSDLDLSGSGKNVVFMDVPEFQSSKPENYFRFRSIENSQNSTKVICHYFYNYNHTTKKGKYLAITVDLQKTGSVWSIVNSDVKGGSL